MTRSGKAIIASAAFVFLVGACGSSSSKSLTPGSNSNSGSNSKSNSNSNSSGGNSLADLLGKGKTADVKVTYKTTDTGDSFTYIQRGNDTVLKTGDSSYYNVGGKTTTCTGSGSSTECTTISSGNNSGLGGALGAGLFGTYSKVLDSLARSPLVKNMKTSNTTIAGRSAKCVTLTGALSAAGQNGTVCIDSQSGLLLRVEAEGKTQFEATSVGSPSDSDFKLPATPKTLSIPSYTVPTTP